MFRNRRFSDDGGGRSFAPINVGDELDVTIEAVGEKGDGLAKVKGFVLLLYCRICLRRGNNHKMRCKK